MKWDIQYSRDADKFIDKQNIRAEVREQLEFFLRKMKGEAINIVETGLRPFILSPILRPAWRD